MLGLQLPIHRIQNIILKVKLTSLLGTALRFAGLLHDWGRRHYPAGNGCADLREVRRISGQKSWWTSGKHARSDDWVHQELLPTFHTRLILVDRTFEPKRKSVIFFYTFRLYCCWHLSRLNYCLIKHHFSNLISNFQFLFGSVYKLELLPLLHVLSIGFSSRMFAKRLRWKSIFYAWVCFAKCYQEWMEFNSF